ncbi:MAG: tetraacyldisaccharide 4'-kinase [Candidatus Omnitrophica bacterium]|nr:tetraacyldisaccharide 4'-kinase [Candidatus Omnitrophota bacterium]
MRQYLYLVMTDQIDGALACVVKIALWILSVFYGMLVRGNVWLYKIKIKKQTRLPKPVISVGNMTWGGAGKTPLVEYLAKVIKQMGYKPVILTRGYMGGKNRQIESDEAKMLEGSLGDVPVLVGPNRAKNALEFLKTHPADVFILDDGFQHLCLYRDLNLVAIDAMNPWGNTFLLPRGILRESLDALQRADMFIVTKKDLADKNTLKELKGQLASILPQKPVIEANHHSVDLWDLRTQETKELSFIAGKNVCCFCSIASPQSFEQVLIDLKAHIQKKIVFLDHHVYEKNDVEEIVQYCRRYRIAILVTTMKDAVKIKKFLDHIDENILILALRIEISVQDGKDVLFGRISSLIQH